MTTVPCGLNLTPYDQSGLIKTPHLVNVNYTCQDFWSLKARLRDLIKERAGDEFNDLVESSLAVMLIENWAFIADLLSFKLDQIANEIFIDTVSQVDNAFRLATLVGFRPTPPIASRSIWSARIKNVLDRDVIINTPVIADISTESGPSTIELYAMDVHGEPLFEEDIIIPAGNFLNTSIIGIEGQSRVQRNSGSGGINQFFRLSYGPVVWRSVRVLVDGVAWEEVDYFTDSQPRPEFRVEYDAEYNAYVMFGNNRAGMIPSIGSDILIKYRTGGGVSGNIVAGGSEIQRNFLVDGLDFRTPVSFQNYTRGEFGYNGDTIDDIKRKLPAYLRAQDRAVSADDFDTLTNQFATVYNGQVGKATSILRNYGCAANVIDIYILARNGSHGLQKPSNELKIALSDFLHEKKMLTDHICVKDGSVIMVDISIDVTLDKYYRKFDDEFQAKIHNRVNAFFSLNNWEYNKDLTDMDLVKAISDIREIKNITVHFTTISPDNSGSMVAAKFYEIIRPGELAINLTYV